MSNTGIRNPSATGTATPRRGIRPSGVWGPATDAVHSAARRFADPVALDVMSVFDETADLLAAIAAACKVIGQTALSEVAIDPRVAHYFESLGDAARQAATTTRDASAPVQRAHREKIDRILEGDPKERAWDHSAHDGYYGRRRRVGRR